MFASLTFAIFILISFQNCSPFQAYKAEDGLELSATSPVNGDPSKFVPMKLLSENLISNSTFESGLDPWYGPNSQVLEGQGINGSNAGRLGGPGGASGSLYFKAAARGDQQHLLEFKHKAEVGGGGSATIYATFADQPNLSLQSFDLFSTSRFQTNRIVFTVPTQATGIIIRFFTLTKEIPAHAAVIDDVYLYEVEPSKNQPVVIAEGDSQTSSNSYAQKYSNINPDIQFSNFAVGGSGISSVESRFEKVLAMKPTNGLFIVTLLIGGNDGLDDHEGYTERVFKYCDRLRAEGALVVLATVLPKSVERKALQNYNRKFINQIYRENVGIRFDALVDFDKSPLIADDLTAENTFYFPDGIHSGRSVGSAQEPMVHIYKETLDTLLYKHGVSSTVAD